MEKKRCKKCGILKPLSKYQIRKESGKLRNECSDCMNAYHREVYLRNLGRFKRDVRTDNREANPKVCIRCGELKPLSEYGWHNFKKGQHRNFCKKCHKEWDSTYKKSPEGKQKIDEWREKNQEKIIAYRELYNKDPRYKEKMKNYSRKSLLKQLGITQEDYDKMFQAQNGKCAICGTSEISRKKKYFCVDHNHVTGQVRGLLCHNCNAGLGHYRDSLELLTQAVQYLKSFNKESGNRR